MSGESPVPQEAIKLAQEQTTSEARRNNEIQPREMLAEVQGAINEKLQQLVAGNTEAIRIFEGEELRDIVEDVRNIFNNSDYEVFLNITIPGKPTYDFEHDVVQNLQRCINLDNGTFCNLQDERNRFNLTMVRDIVYPLSEAREAINKAFEQMSSANEQQPIKEVEYRAKDVNGILNEGRAIIVTIENSIIDELDEAVSNNLRPTERTLKDLRNALEQHKTTSENDGALKLELQQKLLDLEEKIRKITKAVIESSEDQRLHMGSFSNTIDSEGTRFYSFIQDYIK